jgi:hypothetical protein
VYATVSVPTLNTVVGALAATTGELLRTGAASIGAEMAAGLRAAATGAAVEALPPTIKKRAAMARRAAKLWVGGKVVFIAG